MKLTAITIFSILLLSILASAQTFPKPQDKYVNDFANFLDYASISELRNLFYSVEQSTTAEMVVVTMQTTQPYTPSEYRTLLFNDWHIGKADKDNGLLILYAVNERRIAPTRFICIPGMRPVIVPKNIPRKIARIISVNIFYFIYIYL